MGIMKKDIIKGFDWLDVPVLDTKDIVYIGIRDIDKDEHITLLKHNIKCFTMDHVSKFGIGRVVEEALKYLNPNKENNPIHISLDIDGIDPSLASGTGTRSNGGLNYREIHYIVRRFAETGNLVSMDLTEINPDLEDNP
jgi:arginase